MALTTPHAQSHQQTPAMTLRHPDLVAVAAVLCAVAAVVAAVLPYALVCCPLLGIVAVAAGLTSLEGAGRGHALGRSVAVIGVVLGALVLVGSFAVLLLLARLTL